MDEFKLINDYFVRHASAPRLLTDIGDDGAVVETTAGRQVHVLDTLVQAVHFAEDTAPADIAWRAVAVNLSDIAAMGATPEWMTLGLTLPDIGERWVRDFAAGLFDAAEQYSVRLIGGDTTTGSSIVVTIAMTGTVSGEPLLRSGARAGDAIFVTGTVGDAAAALALGDDASDYLHSRFLRPTPRVDIGQQLVGKATAAIDVSDGLAGDLVKLLNASDMGGELDIRALPLSNELIDAFPIERCREFALTGGDDYELCFTGPPGLESVGATRIGQVTDGSGLSCTLDGALVDVDLAGYRHFS